MINMNNFLGHFGSFKDLLGRAGLSTTICRFYDNDGSAFYKIIVGATELDDDIMLHLIDAEGLDEAADIPNAIAEYGVEFRMLSTLMGEYGFDIFPSDQFEENTNSGCCNGDCTNCYADEIAQLAKAENDSKTPTSASSSAAAMKKTLSGKDAKVNKAPEDRVTKEEIKRLEELAMALENIEKIFLDTTKGAGGVDKNSALFKTFNLPDSLFN